MERLESIKILWNDGHPVARTIRDDDIAWLIAEVERLRAAGPLRAAIKLKPTKDHEVTRRGADIRNKLLGR